MLIIFTIDYILFSMNHISPLRFKNPNQNDFVRTLRKRVDAYFKENSLPKTGGWSLKLKALFMFLLYVVPYFLILFSVSDLLLVNWGFAFLMGLGMAGIGFGVMHDANHGSFSRKKWVNNFMGFSINFLGGNVNNWKAQHNIMHHTYTNIEGYDEDIQPAFLLRFSPHAKKIKLHKFQFLYAWILYGLMTVSWTFAKDFIDVSRYNKNGLFKQLKTNFNKELIQIIWTRVFYFIYMLVVPMMVLDFVWWQILIGFFTVHFTAGLTLALIFQLAHVMEDTDFPLPDDGKVVENQWAVHQLFTTSNFAHKNRILSWFVGGLNYQVEHHLFPNISHVHYRKIAPIVKKTAEEFNLPYHSIDSFRSALFSHMRMLYQLGR